MKQISKALIAGTGLLYQKMALANGIRMTADRLGQEASRIGIALGVLFLVLAGILLAMGKQEGTTKLSQAIFGLVVILSAPALVKLIKAVV
ncbi:MAG: hypothetical protein HOE90_13045 [Bacteriovoracaceae bacterium]|jgi:hypothetical protein|nr:hypothetical protein [Bacteriovoracaceae bacterium]